MTTDIIDLEPLDRLTSDLKRAAVTLGRSEARFLVDAYYSMQDNRKRAANQCRALSESSEPHAVLAWYLDQSSRLEKQVARALDAYSGGDPLGQWARSIVGIGPVISAGLLAHIEIEKAPTVGHIWRFAGLDPTLEWKKGEKRPFNAALKTLCWKVGESFVKVSGHEEDIYGKVWAARKATEEARNAAGNFAGQAAAKLEKFRIGKATEAFGHYSSGHLPPAHVHARAKRYAVKLFLAHYHEAGYRIMYGKAPPKPYAIDHLGHAHLRECPNLHLLSKKEG